MHLIQEEQNGLHQVGAHQADELVQGAKRRVFDGKLLQDGIEEAGLGQVARVLKINEYPAHIEVVLQPIAFLAGAQKAALGVVQFAEVVQERGFAAALWATDGNVLQLLPIQQAKDAAQFSLAPKEAARLQDGRADNEGPSIVAWVFFAPFVAVGLPGREDFAAEPFGVGVISGA